MKDKHVKLKLSPAIASLSRDLDGPDLAHPDHSAL